MSLHDDVELACENAEDGLCTVSPDGFGEVGVPVSTLRAILARHPEPGVSEPTAEQVWTIAEGLRKRFAVSNGTQVWVEFQGSAEALADEIADIFTQLQIQAPLGEGLEKAPATEDHRLVLLEPDTTLNPDAWYGECSCHNPDGLGVGRADFTGATPQAVVDLQYDHAMSQPQLKAPMDYGVYNYGDGRFYVVEPGTKENAERELALLGAPGEVTTRGVGLKMQNAATHIKAGYRKRSTTTVEDEREGLIAFFLDDDMWRRARDVQNQEQSRCYAENRPYDHRPHAEFMADAILAAGYRKRPEVTVEDVADIHQRLADAWDEGYRAGKSTCMKPISWDNPYMPTIGGGLWRIAGTSK